MKKKYRTYDEEFRREVISRIDNGEVTKAQAAREYQLSPSLIERWRQQIHDGAMGNRATRKEKQIERELERYKKKVGELSMQVALLKKNSGDLSVHEKVEWVHRNWQTFGSKRKGCKIMELSPSTYYYKPKVSRAERERRDADLRDKIEFVQTEYSAYGYRTIKVQLRRHYDLNVNG